MLKLRRIAKRMIRSWFDLMERWAISLTERRVRGPERWVAMPLLWVTLVVGFLPEYLMYEVRRMRGKDS